MGFVMAQDPAVSGLESSHGGYGYSRESETQERDSEKRFSGKILSVCHLLFKGQAAAETKIQTWPVHTFVTKSVPFMKLKNLSCFSSLEGCVCERKLFLFRYVNRFWSLTNIKVFKHMCKWRNTSLKW